MWTIIHTEASMGWGGQEIRILRESACMRERGHRVIIMAEEDSGLMKKAREAGFETIAMSFLKKDYLASFLKLLKIFKEIRPDVINTHSSRDSWLAGAATKASSVKPALVRTRHLSTKVSQGMASTIVYRKFPDRIITTAEAIREGLIRGNNIDPDTIVSIPTGVDLSLFYPERPHKDLRVELGLPDETILAGMVSVIRSWKGHDYFVEAAEIARKELPQLKFIIAGDGPRREAIEELIRDRGLTDTVLMLGHREDVPDVMASLDILAQPSYSNEGVPQTVLQALAMGLAVVSSDLKPLLEVVKDRETGLVVPAKNSSALAKKIILLARDRKLRERLGDAGRKMVAENFSIDAMADQVEEIYREVCR